MFRQNKRRLASRRNFNISGDSSNDNGAQLILSGSSEEEQKLSDKLYGSKLSFYELPPQGEITLEQFEKWAIDRLKVLLEIESCISRNKNPKEIETVIKPLFRKLLPFNTDNLEDRKKDYYSHFILRLCFCRSKELREKFIRAETVLFKIRFNMLTANDQSKFIKTLDLPLLQFISKEEKNQYSKELYITVSSALQFQLNLTDEQSRKHYFASEKFIKLPFENVIDLVGSRQVFLSKGYAYLPQFQQLNLITSEFSKNLMNELTRTYQYLPRLNEDDRLIPILNHLSSGYTITDFQHGDFANNEASSDINHRSVYTPEITKNYPMCVSNLFEGLEKTHHLRYNGRQQLSFFLKGIGLSCDEAMEFWMTAFTGPGSHVTPDKFQKEYRYNFRHNYGLEGNRINYKPWECRTILSKPRPARGEYHGCPFRDFGHDKLLQKLQQLQLSPAATSGVLDSCERHEYTVACTKVFEATHKGDALVDHITHPNLYFDRSRQFNKSSKPAQTGTAGQTS